MYDAEVRRVEDNIARITVRRHLRELLDSGAPEDDLIRRFHAALQTYPDESYRTLARRVWTDYVIDVETLQQLQRQRAERAQRLMQRHARSLEILKDHEESGRV